VLGIDVGGTNIRGDLVSFAIHVAILANVLDPRLIILGGGLGCARGRYWATFRAALPRFTWAPYASRMQVRRAALGTKVGIIGAALSALENS
jgi:predicted NBD/HSP70 family sugar kinase